MVDPTDLQMFGTFGTFPLEEQVVSLWSSSPSPLDSTSSCERVQSAVSVHLRRSTYSVKGSITVLLTSCLTVANLINNLRS